MITMDVLQKRRDSLSDIQIRTEAELDILKERTKIMKKEVANIKGAIIEIDHLIESTD